MDFLCKKRLFECECDSLIFAIRKPSDDKKVQLPLWANSLEGEFFGDAGSSIIIRNTKVDSRNFSKVLLLGIGEKKDETTNALAGYFARAFSELKMAGSKSIAILLDNKEFAQAISSQICMADYSFQKYKEKKNKDEKLVNSICFVCKEDIGDLIERGRIFGEASNLARSIQNEPGNIATPLYVAKIAKGMAAKKGLKCTILSKAGLQKEKMDAMLAVASGSINEPCLVVLQYMGDKSSKEIDLAIVGKGVTFDSGGISLKPSPAMDEMKFDKSGACATIGAMSALSELGIKKNVVGIAALVENMPGGSAYRPGDIIRASNKKTIEVLNTDAEGRVVLADALAYTCKNFSPHKLIDMATLTGACVVALGDVAAGLMCADEGMCQQLIKCGEKSTERVWRLPHWSDYDSNVQSELADVKNIGEKGSAGTIAGYSFLKPFVDCKSWAHIDIAGTSWVKSPKRGLCVGGTGFGVRICLEYALE